MTSNRNHPGLHTDIVGWKGKTPIIMARRVGVALCFWCDVCDKHHWHGADEGHRHAHCDNADSPYLATGYILKAYAPDAIAQQA